MLPGHPNRFVTNIIPNYSDTTEAGRAMDPSHPLHNSETAAQDANKASVRILICNPNSTAAMTENCVRLVQPTLPRDAEVIGFTVSSQTAPTAVEGFSDAVISAAEAARQVLALRDQYDAVLVACYSDHALIKVLREELDTPVVGIMEASLFIARTLGGRFGILGTCAQSKVSLEDSVRQYGFAGYCAGVASCGLGVLELKTRPEEEVIQTTCDVARDLVARGADTLTLGCAGMIKLQPAIQSAVGEDVQVIDGVVAGVHHLIGIVRMGCKTAKSGLYRSAGMRREARGQLFF